MNCKQAKRMAHALISNRICEDPAADQPMVSEELEEHLWSCAQCRAELEELRTLQAGLRERRCHHAPAQLAARTMSALRVERRRMRRTQRRWAWGRIGWTVAGAVTAVAIAIGLYFAGYRAGATVARAPGQPAATSPTYADVRGADLLNERGVGALRSTIERELKAATAGVRRTVKDASEHSKQSRR